MRTMLVQAAAGDKPSEKRRSISRENGCETADSKQRNIPIKELPMIDEKYDGQECYEDIELEKCRRLFFQK